MTEGERMPVRIAVALTPEHDRAAAPPPHTGPAMYAAFLGAVRERHPELSIALHDSVRYKPFVLTPLLDDCDRAPREAGPARFEVGLLSDELTGPVLGALTGLDRVRVGRTWYLPDPPEVVSAAPYPELALAAEPATEWSFRLLTPVGFASARDEPVRRQRPWPDPVRVLRNLAARWDTFAGDVALPLDTVAVLSDHVEVVDGDLRITEHLVEPSKRDSPAGYLRGSVGTVRYRLADAHRVPAEIRRALDALAGFAEFAGFGDRTAMGMGYVRRT
jgi:CRISPR-associated endoribonuclease Cas6